MARTLVDLAAVVDRRSLERAVDRAEELRVFDLDAVERVIGRLQGQRGVAVLRSVLERYEGARVSRSEAEERMLAVVEGARLPMPEMNAWIPFEDGTGCSPDFLWRCAKLVVEVDGRTYHAKRAAFRRDRRRDRRLALSGFETRRYDASEVVEEPDRVAGELRAFLANALE